MLSRIFWVSAAGIALVVGMIIQGDWNIDWTGDDEVSVRTARTVEEKVDRAIDAIHRAIADIRESIMGLRPAMAGASLTTGIDALADDLRLTTAIDVETRSTAAPADLVALDDDARNELLHLVREALSNIARHSRATRARIELTADDDEVRLEIVDNGVGFDPAAAAASGHHGLVNLRERAAAAGGRLGIETRPGSGTRLLVHLPIRPEAPIP